ncbi:MAG: hypothetical protein ACP5NQ_08465 [Vulcanisaeta sp.]
MIPQKDTGSILSSVPHYRLNPFINRCPSCGSIMIVDGEWIREDNRRKAKLVERSLTCPNCKVRIRQYIYLQ